jgi:hypothetical protein
MVVEVEVRLSQAWLRERLQSPQFISQIAS